MTNESETRANDTVAEAPSSAEEQLSRLIAIMARLRDPERGCPWDVKQSFDTIVPYTIEEAYEVADAIERGDMDDLKDELGDLLLQVVFHARMAEEAGHFAFVDVARAISEKLIRRHPHVFEGAGGALDAKATWEAIKADERKAKAERRGTPGAADPETSPRDLFDGIGAGLPALLRSTKLQGRAASVGFDWPNVAPVLDKVDEELAELRAEIAAPAGPETDKRRFEEFGDLMFVVVNLGRWLDIDPEAALRSANAKFIRRMGEVVKGAEEEGRKLEEMRLDEMGVYWDRAKAREREQGGK
ncbi:nucleoside triphosphate pyrophosphohydrolase [Rhodomicrobium lacus]|uniref:nucleoside triphosphate pyrophosphohydrolase n=1 Tax=Rhodomicrobium lacus TaxID=2498452 RepID=UPI0026E42E00|nr:nucleoside triphosphate pyrophosphohydrolase [Rhodomicrobium lacus]WKW51638.1 nucleoside triphosphate pyrophosphohydrolase [Rhodomicrobium lacus]